MAAVEPHLGTAEGPVTAADIERAAELIAGDVRETPVLPAGELSRRVGTPVVLKAECLQLTGSFKVRGVFHKMGRLSPDQLDRGVVAASAGNHAQAVALAADRLNTRADLFMPIEAPLAKLTAVRAYGGKVHLVDGSYDEAGAAARDFSEREGKTLVPAFDDPEIVAGQGSVGLEIARQAPATRLVVVPLGGGGLASGVAIAIKSRLGEAKVIGVQAEACAPYLESLAARRPIGARSASTICDGIAVKRPGDLTLPLVERYLDGIATVSDDEVAEAMVLLLERSKLVVEGAGAAGVAALLGGKIERPADGEICAVLSGGNVDASRLAECIRLGETAAGRRIVLWTVVPDRPGALAALLRLVAEHGANVVDVEHIREGVELHVRETAIELVLQTDGPEHSERIVEAVRAEGFSTRLER
jgi:threonine dehydratase